MRRMTVIMMEFDRIVVNHHTLDAIEQDPLQYSTKGVTFSILSGFPEYYTFRVRFIVQG
jgi:hypothetical protein